MNWKILTPLMPHQSQAFRALSGASMGLFMFPGAGKSLVALTHARSSGCKRILITADKTNAVSTWQEQILRHTTLPCFVRPTVGQLDHLPEECAVLVNYDLLWRRQEEYSRIKWNMWIGDESSEFKDQRTHKHKGLQHVVMYIPIKLILNGCPVTERLEDLWGQVRMLDNGARLGETLTKFRWKYMVPHPSGYGWLPKANALACVRRDIADISYWDMDRSTVKLPEAHVYEVEVDMTPQQKTLDQQLKKEFHAELERAVIDTKYAAVLYLKRYQLCGGTFRPSDLKGDALHLRTNKDDCLKKIMYDNQGAKFVIWHSFVPETRWLQDILLTTDQPYICFDGPGSLDKFKYMKRGVFLIRTAFCRGINALCDADIAIFWSNPLSYARRVQAEGRTRRIGSSQSDTHYIDLVTKGGADSKVLAMLRRKQNFSLTISGLQTIGEEDK